MSSTLSFVLTLALFIAIFYLLILLPQQRRMKEHRALLDSLSPGDRVVTSGGLYGTVSRVEEEAILLEVAQGVKVRVAKQAVLRRVEGRA